MLVMNLLGAWVAFDAGSRIPVEEIGVGRSDPFHHNTWRSWFVGLRAEASVHYLSDSVDRPFWPVTTLRWPYD